MKLKKGLAVAMIGFIAIGQTTYATTNINLAEDTTPIITDEMTTDETTTDETTTDKITTDEDTIDKETVDSNDLGENTEIENTETENVEGENTLKSTQGVETKQIKVEVKNSSEVKNFNNTYYISSSFIKQNFMNVKANWDAAQKKTTFNYEGSEYICKVGEKNIIKNGTVYSISMPILMKQNKMWVPAKDFMKLVGGAVQYNATNKTLLIDIPLTEVERNNTAPIAEFRFYQESYIDGQAVQIEENHRDLDGHKITAYEWQLVGHSKVFTSYDQVKAYMTIGQNQVGVRVKDELGKWSEWHFQKVTIEPNKAPVLGELKTNKESYAQGEKIEFEPYTYENEQWENIVEEKWAYRCLTDEGVPKQDTRPVKLFHEGTYEVTLQIKDAKNNWSLPVTKTFTVTEEIVQSEMMYRFTEGAIGDVFDNYRNFNFQQLQPLMPDRVTYTGATLLVSNSPESVYTKGVLYEDTFQGEGRVMYHHKNITTDGSKKRFAVVMENVNPFPVTVVQINESFKGPVEDVLHLGQQVTLDILDVPHEKVFTLQPGEKRFLYDTGSRNWKVGDTVSGMVDLYCQSEIKITTAMIGDQTQLKHFKDLPYLQRDGVHTRGTFPEADRYYTLTLSADTANKFMLGLPWEEFEPHITGYDALTGQEVINKGNYGVKYHLKLKSEGRVGILLNPRANVFKGAIGWANDKSYLIPRGYLSGAQNAVKLGVMEKGEEKELLYMLPNGSAAPVLMCFVPENLWNQY